uniref:non-specific serine/threonine protein kinase n=1 Tax=Oryza meridionalis TaxID=40149 RepID=A0A0E0DP04_9ORYZ
MRRCSSWQLLWLVLVCSWRIAAAQAQAAPRTDPTEAAALNTILGRWGKKASSEWNISGELCSGLASDKTNWDDYPNINPFIKCDCSYNNNSVCHIIKLRVYKLNVVGQLPSELQNFTYMEDLNLAYNYLSGVVPSFIGKNLAFNPLSGQLPKEIGNLTNLLMLGVSFNNFTGELPEELGNLVKLEQLYIDSSGFSGPFPLTFSKLQRLKILRAQDNDFTGKIPDNFGSMSSLEDMRIGDIVNGSSSLAFISNLTSLSNLILRNCRISGNLGLFSWEQQPYRKSARSNKLFVKNIRFFLQPAQWKISFLDYSFAVDCGSNSSTSASDNTIFEADPMSLGTAAYYVTGQTRWGVSSVGNFFQATNGMDRIYSSSNHFQNTVDSKLFETARMSPSSLRYYGLGLENGNYTVLLQFAEFSYTETPTWQSLGRRVFDIYVQGALKEKNFDIRKTAGGKSFTAVNRSYTATVSKNFIEIHLFWAGKGTCCVPTQGHYGPTISALSITPNFTPTVRNGVPKKRSKAGAIVGIMIGASVFGLAALFGIFFLVKKRRTMAQQRKELYDLVGRPDVFSSAELKLATNNFSSQNILGEGGYGPVYKGKLSDGKVVAVKQLSESSHQGKSQFVTEVATISAVQHRNLVKLHGCCIDSKSPLLVYEYLENGSLDQALFRDTGLKLDWTKRFEIILGIARGLTYLHEESSVRIVHRDIKASNVLLDTDLTPKISDFGLAKLYDEKKTHISTAIAGTFGYLAPEYAMRGRLTEKADVFAFGVVALETVAGRSNIDNSLEESKVNLFGWAWSLYEKEQALEIVDPRIKEFSRDEALRVIHVALMCTQGSPHQRPPMSKVVAMLTGDVEVAEVIMKPSYITEWLHREGDSSYFTNYAGSATPEFSGHKETIREMRRWCSRMSGLVWVVLVCSWTWRIAAAQAPQPPKTDPLEAVALNTILGRWGKKASSEWNISGEPCSGLASDKSDWDNYPNINPFIKCDCTFSNNTLCHITRLRVTNLSVVGEIPLELQNFTYMLDLNLGYNYLTGAVPSFFGKFTFMKYLAFPFNALSGPLPKELGNLTNLLSLGISFNNFSGQLPEELGNMTNLQQMITLQSFNNRYIDSCGFSGPFPSTFSKLQNLKILRSSDNDFTGKIPDYLGIMPKLEDIRIGDIVNGSSSLAFISNLTSLSNLILRNCKISGNLAPVDFSKFGVLTLLFLGNNSFTGSLPDAISPSLKAINLVANNFELGTIGHSTLPSGLNCLQQDTPCFRGSPEYYSFAVDCGNNRTTRGLDGTIYEPDAANLGAASYYVTSDTRWGVSNVGNYFLATDGVNIINSPQKIQNVLDSRLFETARMSASSVRYYGLGLENGNYTVLLQFAEFAYPDTQSWLSLGRRVFDIYVQGDLKEKNFDIRKMAGGKSFTAVNRSYTARVSKNFLEIHLFWADFTPTVRNGVPKRRSKAGAIAGITIGALVLGVVSLFGIFLLVKKRRTIAQQQEELYNLAGQPDVFSNTELKLATDNFSYQNIIGEGGYGPVYKGKLPDGRVIAVKQLSETSHQGKSQFVTEVATISAVQHRNLVKLHGCCIDSKTPLLVYEYLENGSMDRAIFGHSSLKLDWATRFDIILGIARGLTYLHEESSVRIVHRDIKASNVLLDTDLTPKISDFGLAKLYDEKKTHVSTRIAGTMGYLAPEYAMRGHLSEKADVFAFGVLMLETVAGRSNTNNSLEESKIYLLEWAWGLYEMGQALHVVDPCLKEFDEKEAFRVICIALLCTQGSPHQRPPMSRVVAMLTGDVDVAEVVTKPSYITEWQLRDGGSSSYTTSSYAGSSNPEFSRQRETNPLAQSSPTITKASLVGR